MSLEDPYRSGNQIHQQDLDAAAGQAADKEDRDSHVQPKLKHCGEVPPEFESRENKGWEQFISTVALAYNTKVNTATGVTPFEAWMGRTPRLPIDLIIPPSEKRYPPEEGNNRDTM